MGSDKKKCWEEMNCGREPGGKMAEKLGICPAASLTSDNSGSDSNCWQTAGSFASNPKKGVLQMADNSCMECKFYNQVFKNEGTTSLESGDIRIFAHTHIGKTRKSNEDRYFLKKLEDDSILLAVADGMGGEAAGDYAAEIVAAKLSEITHIEKSKETKILHKLAMDADKTITDIVEEKPELEGMGTTMVCVFIRDGYAYWVNVGDSRFYILREEELLQVTEDQTLAKFLLEEGEITEDEVPGHYSRHILDQSVGCGFCEPETGSNMINKNELVLLASDGLHGMINNEKISSVLNNHQSFDKKAESLINAALNAGGRDNVTVILAEV